MGRKSLQRKQARTHSKNANGHAATPPAENTLPAVPDSDGPGDNSDCDREFDLYEPERQELRKTELDAEKNYDTMLVTLSSLALGLSLTILKDFVGKDKAVWLWSIGLAWAAFVACLLLALWDKRLTFRTHRAWRELLDEKFADWKPGTWDDALKNYDRIPGINSIDKIKAGATVSLIVGIAMLSVFVTVNFFLRSPSNAATQSAAPSTSAPAGSNTGAANPAAIATASAKKVAASSAATPTTSPNSPTSGPSTTSNP